METSISRYFTRVEDPRIERNKLYPLEEVLLVGLCSIISGGEGFNDMVLYGENKLDILREIYPFEHGIASEDTFGRVYSLLDPKLFRDCFIDWVQDIQKRTSKSIAIDGKTSRRTYSEKQSALHLVSAWAREEGLVLAAQAVEEGSNEITAIKELLEILDLKGSVVTIDAIGCQKAISKRIIERGGDYVLALKDNQASLRNSVEAVFKGEKKVRFGPTLFSEHEIIEKEHGRIETRKYRAIDVKNLPIDVAEWKGIKSLVEVESTREIKEKKSVEKRYYISSLEAQAQEMGRYIRGHWTIENSLHWVLDVVFREDESRIRNKNAPKNMATLRHTALNLIKKDPKKGSIRGKRKKAGWNDRYLISLLSLNF